jgi:hypothetical protein
MKSFSLCPHTQLCVKSDKKLLFVPTKKSITGMIIEIAHFIHKKDVLEYGKQNIQNTPLPSYSTLK